MKKRENKYLYLWHLKVFVITQLYRPRDEEYKAENWRKKIPRTIIIPQNPFPTPKNIKKLGNNIQGRGIRPNAKENEEF